MKIRLSLSAHFFLILSSFSQLIFSADSNNTNFCSKTFFMPRSIIEDVIFTLNNTNYYNYYQKEGDTCVGFSISVSPFFQRSRNSGKLARFFLPCNQPLPQRPLVIAQDGSGDIGSLWLNLAAADGASFRSAISICPRRSINGVVINARQEMGYAYFDLNLAYVRTKHEMRLLECCPTGTVCVTSPTMLPPSCIGVNTVTSFSCTCTAVQVVPINSAIAAFNNPAIRFGKIPCESLVLRGLDDVEVKLGYNFKQDACGHFSLYGAGLISTERIPRARFLFEPIIGRGGHHAVGLGLSAGSVLYNCNGETIVAWLANLDYRHFFRGNECRSVDLCNGNWSRFLLTANSNNPIESSPALNFLTRPFCVEPRDMINFWTALHYEHHGFHVEFGYNVWWKNHECLRLKPFCNPTQAGIATGIFDLTGAALGIPVSASQARINQSNTGPFAAPSDAVFTPITASQLNISSATMPAVLTNKIYGTIALSFPTWCASPIELVLGGAYEFSRNNAALEQWAAWFKVIFGY